MRMRINPNVKSFRLPHCGGCGAFLAVVPSATSRAASVPDHLDQSFDQAVAVCKSTNATAPAVCISDFGRRGRQRALVQVSLAHARATRDSAAVLAFPRGEVRGTSEINR